MQHPVVSVYHQFIGWVDFTWSNDEKEAGSPSSFVRGPHKLLHNSWRAGNHVMSLFRVVLDSTKSKNIS